MWRFRRRRDKKIAREDTAWTIGKSRIHVGAFTYHVANLNIRQWGEGAGLKIGRFCSLADNITVFLGGNHRVDWATTFPFGHICVDDLGGEGIVGCPRSSGDVVIGDDVWIGAGATIMSGVTIGTGAVIAAQAVVVGDVAPYDIVGGNPARVIRNRFSPQVVSLLLDLSWWNLPVETIRDIAPDLCTPPTVEGLHALIARTKPHIAT